MARIRSVKPEFWKSEAIAALSMQTRLTFIALWTYVDDNGVGRDVEKLIAAELYPLEDDPRETLAHVSRSLAELSEQGRIVRYRVEGKPYLSIVNWTEHQKIDKPNKPRYPGPEQADKPLTSDSRQPRESVASVPGESRETPAPGAVEQGISGAEEVPTTSGAVALHVPDSDDAHLGNVVAAYVEGATTAGLPRPSERLRGKVGRDARRLAEKEHVPIPALITAARSMGSRGWDDLDREIQRVGATSGTRSTTDDRVAAGLSLAAQLKAEGR